MKKQTLGFSNSPITKASTPIRRLGLSRKRKSNGFVSCENYNEECSITSAQDIKKIKEAHNENSEDLIQEDNLLSTTTPDSESIHVNQPVDYKEEIKIIEKRIEEKQKSLETLKETTKKVVELEDLIEVWKKGCKKAVIHFKELLKENNNIDLKAALKALGVLDVVEKLFDNDSDLSDFSQ